LNDLEAPDVSPYTGSHPKDEAELKRNCTDHNRLDVSFTFRVGIVTWVTLEWPDADEAFIHAAETTRFFKVTLTGLLKPLEDRGQ
jgi:hypothetical protein